MYIMKLSCFLAKQ